jgi:hypothetical protein
LSEPEHVAPSVLGPPGGRQAEGQVTRRQRPSYGPFVGLDRHHPLLQIGSGSKGAYARACSVLLGLVVDPLFQAMVARLRDDLAYNPVRHRAAAGEAQRDFATRGTPGLAPGRPTQRRPEPTDVDPMVVLPYVPFPNPDWTERDQVDAYWRAVVLRRWVTPPRRRALHAAAEQLVAAGVRDRADPLLLATAVCYDVSPSRRVELFVRTAARCLPRVPVGWGEWLAADVDARLAPLSAEEHRRAVREHLSHLGPLMALRFADPDDSAQFWPTVLGARTHRFGKISHESSVHAQRLRLFAFWWEATNKRSLSAGPLPPAMLNLLVAVERPHDAHEIGTPASERADWPPRRSLERFKRDFDELWAAAHSRGRGEFAEARWVVAPAEPRAHLRFFLASFGLAEPAADPDRSIPPAPRRSTPDPNTSLVAFLDRFGLGVPARRQRIGRAQPDPGADLGAFLADLGLAQRGS